MSRRWMLAGVVVVGALLAGLSEAQEPAPDNAPPAGAPQAGAKAPAKQTRAATAKIQRGKYIASSMGCADCHSPGGFAGKPDATRALAGSEIGWQGPWGVSYPANLTPHETGLAAWSEDDIVRALKQGIRPDGTQLRPPMPWPALSNLTDEDAYAVAAYLKSLPPIDHQEPPPVAPGEPLPAGAVVIMTPQTAPAWDMPQQQPGQPQQPAPVTP